MIGKFFECEADKNGKYYRVIHTVKEYDDGKRFPMDEAIDVVSKTCAYTNHTILAEALEKWPLHYLEKVVPQLVPIIKELAKRVAEKYSDPRVQIIDESGRVHMAHIDIHYGFSVNGVAAIHTEILKTNVLKNFYQVYPYKFNNKTFLSFGMRLLEHSYLILSWHHKKEGLR